jgi:MoaA/NifB/PqqE/SkfB family radical SAM enzyme
MKRRLRPSTALSMVGNSLAYNCLGPFRRRPSRPRALCLYVTYRCNMKCRVCGIWKAKPPRPAEEMTAAELRRVLSDPLFSKLEFININGGEPNLRSDLLEIIERTIRQFPALKRLSLNTNGLPPDRVLKNVERAARLCRAAALPFSVSVSFHGLGPTFDRIAGVPGAFARVQTTLNGLKEVRRTTPFFLSANCVICRLNLDQLDDIRAWGRREGIPVNFALGEVRPRFLNDDMARDILIPADGRTKLLRFLKTLALAKREYLQHAVRYAHLAKMVEFRTKRTLGCHYALGGVVLGSRGEVFYCKNSRSIGNARKRPASGIYYDPGNLKFRREEILGQACAACPPYSFNQIEVEKELFRIMTYFLGPGPATSGRADGGSDR